MQRASLDDFERDPVRRYVVGETFAHFCVSPALWGFLVWGRPSRADVLPLGRSLVFELGPPARPHVSIVDASHLDGGDPGAFEALEQYVTHHAALLGEFVRKLALVRRIGLGGAIVAGAKEVVPFPYSVAVFDDVHAALTWLAPMHEGEDLSPSTIAATLSDLYDTVRGTPPFLGALQALLEKHLGGMTLTEAAGALAVSDRTLQRKLSALGTTFQAEMAAARIRAAQRLLRDSDAPVTTIAFEVGCASPQHFGALFRKQTGQSPGAWRRLHRGG